MSTPASEHSRTRGSERINRRERIVLALVVVFFAYALLLETNLVYPGSFADIIMSFFGH